MAFLPAPNLIYYKGPSEDDLRAVGITETGSYGILLAAQSLALAAVSELKSHRPVGRGPELINPTHGKVWNAAVQADVELLNNGEKPRHVAEILRGEPDRYGLARSAFELHKRRVNEFRRDSEQHAEFYRMAKEQSKLLHAGWLGHISKAWAAIRDGEQRSVALAHYERSVPAADAAALAIAVANWASSGEWQAPIREGNTFPTADKKELGLVTAVRVELGIQKGRWVTPPAYEWPKGFYVVGHVIDDPETQTDVLRKGHHAPRRTNEARQLDKLRSGR